MKKLRLLLSIYFFSALSIQLAAQDTLPKFSLKNVGNKRIVIGWFNSFETVKQISIQRSFDSTKNFKTILTVADPSLPENGFVDTKAENDRMFYRLYIMLEKGAYLFSDAKRPVLDTVVKRDAVKSQLPGVNTPVIISDSVVIGPIAGNSRPKAELYVPSKRIFTFKDGYVRIVLPKEEEKKYDIKFFTSDDNLLFELKDVKERSFKIDKTNFYHAGWFKFELYENGELLEKNKFYIPKEF
ncbi:MAG TPA: hypothetical protein PK951_01775 [Chitinophagaceae bacterium]|nr:hypothetical protein [Chitinophagaceae bacterium]HUM64562.1 hypothetical protein [Chitinophagaceae bacterium]